MQPHESPWVVTAPLMLLAIPSVVIGSWTIQPMLFGGLLQGRHLSMATEKHHAAMEELGRSCSTGRCRWRAHGSAPRRSGWRWPVWPGLLHVCTWSTRAAGGDHEGARPAGIRCWRTSTTWTGSTKNPVSWRARSRHRPVEGGATVIDGPSGQRFPKVVGWCPARCAGCSRATSTTTRSRWWVFVLMTYFVWLNKVGFREKKWDC